MKKNLLALSLGAAMVAGAAAPAFADDEVAHACTSIEDVVNNHVEDGNSVETVEYYPEEKNASGTRATSVYAVIGSTYKVTIPKVIVLKGVAGGESSATYFVDVDGDIAGDNYVEVKPAATFTMSQAGKADVTASVSQAVNAFYSKDLTADAKAALAENAVALKEDDADSAAAQSSETSGTVKANITAGTRSGAFKFEIRLN